MNGFSSGRQPTDRDVPMMDSSGSEMVAFGTNPEQNPYFGDDFRPLRDAGKNIMQMLRRDETSVHGDLYRRIMSTNPAGRIGSSNGGSSRIVDGANASRVNSSMRSANDAESNPAHKYFPPGSDGSNKIEEKADVDPGPIQHKQTIPLPPYLQEVRFKAKVSILMGLFPEAELAWMTADDTVYLWTYHRNGGKAHGIRGTSASGGESQFLEFKVPSKQPIVSVGLAPPKKGEFRITYIDTVCVFLFVSKPFGLRVPCSYMVCYGYGLHTNTL